MKDRGNSSTAEIVEAEPLGLRAFSYWMPSIVWAAAIWVSSSRHSTGLSQGNATLAHLFTFGILALFFTYALCKTTSLTWRQVLIAAVLLASAFGGIDEFHQSFVSGREASALDWLTDTLGGFGMATSLLPAYFRRGRAKKAPSDKEGT